MSIKRPQVSFIVPVYNPGELLRRCMDALFVQTHDDFEIVLVNDGSTDPLTLDLLDEYVSMDARVRLYHKDNGGQSDARNYGLNHAQGDYVAFVDHDDAVEPVFAELLVQQALKTGADVTMGQVAYHTNRGVQILPEYPDEDVISLVDYQYLLTKQMLHWKNLYRRTFLLENLIKWPDVRWGEDIVFSCMVLVKANKIALVHEVVYHYYLHAANTMSNLGRKTFDIIKTFQMIKLFGSIHDPDKKYYDSFLARAAFAFIHNLKTVPLSMFAEFYGKVKEEFEAVNLEDWRQATDRKRYQRLQFILKHSAWVYFIRYNFFSRLVFPIRVLKAKIKGVKVG